MYKNKTEALHDLAVACHKLADKHDAFIRRSKVTDELMYTIDGQVRTTMDWNIIHSELLELENRNV